MLNLVNAFKTVIINNIPSGGKTLQSETLQSTNVFDNVTPDREWQNEPVVEISEQATQYGHYLNGFDVYSEINIYCRNISKEAANAFGDWINDIITTYCESLRNNKTIEDFILDSSITNPVTRGLDVGSEFCNVATFNIYY